MGKVNNALKMLAILRSRYKVTRKELAEELEVGIREISRYKDDLESAGVYITNIKGKYGGYVLENKDYLLNLELSKEEENSLEYVLEYTKDKSFLYYKELKSAINKIKAVSPKGNTIINKIQTNHKGAKAKIEYEVERKKWLTINDGIINNRKLNIEYKSVQGKSSKRVIRPYALFTYYEANYCIAYCEERKELRQFKLMRIDNIDLLNEKFEKMDFDIDSYLYNTMGLFKDELVKMKLKISYPYAKGFSEVSWIKDEKITDYIDEGYLIYEAECFGKKHIINWIMSMGSNCEVLEPKALKDEIIKEYENILKNIYKGAR